MDITDQVLPMLAFLSALLKSSSVVIFLKAGVLFLLAGMIVKIFTQQIYPRMDSIFKR